MLWTLDRCSAECDADGDNATVVGSDGHLIREEHAGIPAAVLKEGY